LSTSQPSSSQSVRHPIILPLARQDTTRPTDDDCPKAHALGSQTALSPSLLPIISTNAGPTDGHDPPRNAKDRNHNWGRGERKPNRYQIETIKLPKKPSHPVMPFDDARGSHAETRQECLSRQVLRLSLTCLIPKSGGDSQLGTNKPSSADLQPPRRASSKREQGEKRK